MNFIYIGILLVVLSAGGFYYMKYNDGVGMAIGMLGLLGAIIFIIPAVIELSESDDQYNKWFRNRKRVEVYLMSLDKIDDTQQLLIIYNDVKDSNEKLIESKEGASTDNWCTDFYDKRFLNHEPIILPNKSGDSYLFEEEVQVEKEINQ